MSEKTKGVSQKGSTFPLKIKTLGKGNGVVPFTQFIAERSEYEGEMAIVGTGIAEKLLQVNLAWS